MGDREPPEPPQWTHGGHPVIPAWVAEFEGHDEPSVLRQAAEWLARFHPDAIAVLCSNLGYIEDGLAVLAICYRSSTAYPGPFKANGSDTKAPEVKECRDK